MPSLTQMSLLLQKQASLKCTLLNGTRMVVPIIIEFAMRGFIVIVEYVERYDTHEKHGIKEAEST